MAWVEDYTLPMQPTNTDVEAEEEVTSMGTSEISQKMFSVATDCFWWIVPTPRRYNDERDSDVVLLIVMGFLTMSLIFTSLCLRSVLRELRQLWHEHFEKI